MVTVSVARSSSSATAANPVMLLIIGRRPRPIPRDCALLRRHHPSLGLPSFEELHLIKHGVGAAGPIEQFVMASHLDDAASFQHDDRIGALNGGQAVRDN